MTGTDYGIWDSFNESDTSVLLTVTELAEYLGIGKNRAYDLLRDGNIKGFRIGCTWKVSKAAVLQYIKEQTGIN
ncbi:MAG: helix-turn-helix domain-containing protein [Lachnospiraceae bacterium]|nr:helix-turn-helix domain-containing protein [Lachnospiraceae bacterium]